MDPLLLARLQVATTASIHFLFVVLTLGLVTLLVGLQGVPAHSAGYRHIATAFVAVSAATVIALVAVHGATFLALRLGAGEAEHFAQLGRRLVVMALGVTGAAVVVGAASHRVRDAVRHPYALTPVHTVGQECLTISDAAADPATLRLLNWLAAPLIPALVGVQARCWWVFRGRMDPRTAIFY
jgi:cytochrome d ubiquinol oxidase subunit II